MGLNYIWDLVIKAREAGIPKGSLTFVPAEVYSPYMELSQQDLNAGAAETRVEVNPYYRFEDIFQQLFDLNLQEDAELRATLFDIVIHFLADLDMMQGMNKREYHIRFVIRDLLSGRFGERIAQQFGLFDKEEQDRIADSLLSMYDTGESLHLLKSLISRTFRSSTIYVNSEEKDEMLIYIGQKSSARAAERLELILDLFLPVRFRTEIYWDAHFGILEQEETMLIDQIALY
ncbi:iron-dependent peroxidase [Paenibacillus sp. CAA11]|uniref:iron-dependent peroxidase n=1 Tax=Paenibacillus sp. CAA11 TaxID=1532905 RepID=UPI000D34789C|nr:iron-dependent peroxidase [Paenibacillus sp. CAA11]AWB43678.1 iron-dependent peroxidase [Paenibacillus sp. CAA11]